MLDQIGQFLRETGYAHFVLGFVSQGAWKELVMVAVACLLLYLAIRKQYEPLLLMPIAFGMLLVNLGPTGLMSGPDGSGEVGGLLHYLYQGVRLGVYPPLIFLGIGALTDFGPLIANPRSVVLGAAAQFGIFTTFVGALVFGFSAPEAASIGIIGARTGRRRSSLHPGSPRTF